MVKILNFSLHIIFFQDVIFSVAVSPDNQLIASGSEDKSLQIYDIHTNELVYQFLAAHEGIFAHFFLLLKINK